MIYKAPKSEWTESWRVNVYFWSRLVKYKTLQWAYQHCLRHRLLWRCWRSAARQHSSVQHRRIPRSSASAESYSDPSVLSPCRSSRVQLCARNTQHWTTHTATHCCCCCCCCYCYYFRRLVTFCLSVLCTSTLTYLLTTTTTREHRIRRITFATETNAACSQYVISSLADTHTVLQHDAERHNTFSAC